MFATITTIHYVQVNEVSKQEKMDPALVDTLKRADLGWYISSYPLLFFTGDRLSNSC